MDLWFFFCVGKWGRWIFVVHIVFPQSSQDTFHVPNVFLNMFPIAFHFIPYPLPYVLILKIYGIQPKGGDYNISILGMSKT
jgi:hypothetical protein